MKAKLFLLTALVCIDLAAVDFQKAIDGLNAYRDLQSKVGIQDSNISYAMQKAIVLADLLIDSQGNLDLSVCSQAKPYFVPAQPLEYEANMGRILDQLDSSWQSYLAKITAPTSSVLLQVLFGLSPQDGITDRHARVAVLGSVLSPYNQGPVGDCFAVADLVRNHYEYSMHTAEDCANIIETGYLTRLVNQTNDNFFFLPVLADDNLSATVSLDASGNISGTQIPFLSAPGFERACKVMGGDPTQLSQAVLQNLPQGQLTVSQVIAAISSAINGSDPNLGNYAFSALTNNPVLKAIECAYASMAEDRSQDNETSDLSACVATALKSKWDSLGTSRLVGVCQTFFTNNLSASYRYVYNPNIPLAQPSSDGSSTDGGFQLYQRNLNDPTVLGTRVATPDDFKNLILSVIATTSNVYGSDAITNALADYVKNGPFLRDALWAFDDSNKSEQDPVANYQLLSRTPMQSCDGDNPFEVDDIETGQNYDPGVQNFKPSNASDLINWALNIAKKVPIELYPMDSPQHAFNFTPGNAEIVSFVSSDLSSNQWLRQFVMTPGLKVATRTLGKNVAMDIANQMYQLISKIVPKAGYNTLVTGLTKQPMTLQQYTKGLYSGICTLAKANANLQNQIGLSLDGIALQCIDPNDLNALQQTAVRFANTNWNDGVKDIYFCAYYNPRTGLLGFGTLDEDRTGLQPMDENAWVNGQQWDIDLNPLAPAS